MHGDPELGTVLRGMRRARGLTLATLARKVGCSESLLSQIETGARALQVHTAGRLDAAFGTGGTVTALVEGTYAEISPHHQSRGDGDLILVRIPRRGLTVPVSRRELLAALGVGALSGSMLGGLQQATSTIVPDEELLSELESTLTGLQAAGRLLPPGRLVGPLTGQIALIDAVRRRAPDPLRAAFTLLQTRGAESLSWMAEESGDLPTALYWTDRAQQWAGAAGWQAMVSYSHVRRSMLAISFASDGLAAVEQARHALRTPGTPPRVKAMAAKQMAFGFALAHQGDASRHALDQTLAYFTAAENHVEHGPTVGQRSVADPDLLAIYQATCDVYLGGGTTVVDTLQPGWTKSQAVPSARTPSLPPNSPRPTPTPENPPWPANWFSPHLVALRRSTPNPLAVNCNAFCLLYDAGPAAPTSRKSATGSPTSPEHHPNSRGSSTVSTTAPLACRSIRYALAFLRSAMTSTSSVPW
jgi:transcriptional regulator with XRE-family HTH domain